MSDKPEKLQKLCKGVRAIGPSFEIHLKPSDQNPDEWAVMVIAGGAAILVNTDFAPIEESVDQALRRLTAISQKTLVAVRQSNPPPAPDTEKESDKK
jgi:hypothetical protein